MRGADIAVLIPVLNEAARIGRRLDELTALGFGEIVVSDGGSSDSTASIAAGRPGVRMVAGVRGRGAQLQAALRHSSAPIVLILHADTQLPESAARLIRAALSDPAVAGGSFRMRFDNPSLPYAVYGWFTRFETPFTTFGDQAFFARRAAIEAGGGVPDWPLLEDVELRRRLLRQGRFVKLAAAVTTSARRFERYGVVRGQLLNALIVAGFWLGLSPRWLAARYRAEEH
jgi:rSAM/selenodomain-associated transferase 2